MANANIDAHYAGGLRIKIAYFFSEKFYKWCVGKVAQCISTLKRMLVDTYAYKLQPSLSERVILDGHGCHTALHFDVKAKENQEKFLHCTGYLNSIKPLQSKIYC